MKNFYKYITAAVLAILFAFIFFMNSFKLPPEAAKLPRILMAVIVLLSLGVIWEAYRKSEKAEEPGGDAEASGEINHVRAFIFAAMVAVYIFVMKPIGYFIITPIYIIATYMFLKATKLRNMILIAAGFTIFVYFVFVVFLKLPIPMGILK